MKKISLKNHKESLSRDEMRSISAGRNASFTDVDDEGCHCSCRLENGSVGMPVQNFDQCLNFCQSFEGLESTWCFG